LNSWYQSLWTYDFFIGFGDFNLLSHHGKSLTSLEIVNDGLMTIFFFMVGLEVKREVLVGQLSSFRQAILPIIASIGGMLMPVLVFTLVGKYHNLSPEELRGAAIPMATDIAFSLGVLSLLGKRVPLSLKIFLLTSAIADDIGGILVIAVVYSHLTTQSLIMLGISLVLFGLLYLGNRLRINNQLYYFFLGLAIWYLFLQAGIHPTISGVLVAFTIPARPYIDLKKYTDSMQRDLDVIKTTIREGDSKEDRMLSGLQVKYLSRIEAASDRAISPLQDIEDTLGDLVNYIIMPLFAFANAGVIFNLSDINLLEGVSSSIFFGLLIGKFLGIFSFTFLAIKLRISKMPDGMNWANLSGLAMLCGIGFTVSLFMAGLSYELGSDMLNDAKLGIIFGSVASGIVGYFILRMTLKKTPHETEEAQE
jgi:NhaA family Na+:H+ antiporter